MTGTRNAPADGLGRTAGGWGALFMNEALKTRKRLAFWATLGLFAVINGGGIFEFVRQETNDADRVFALPESWPEVLTAAAALGPFFVALLTILLTASEFQWRTARQNVIDGLSKERFYVGKVMATVALVVLFFAVPPAIGVVGALVSPGENGPHLVQSNDVSYLAGYALSLAMLASAGLMLAVLVRSAGPALGVLFAYMLVEQFLGFFLGRSESLREVVRHFPLSLKGMIETALFHYPDRLAEANAYRAQTGQPPLEFLDAGVVFPTMLLYTVVFLAVAFYGMTKRDL